MKRVLTALQPSGFLHIGNYFGAIEPMLQLQKENDLKIFVVDYHAITVPQKPDELRRNILFATAVYLAAGVDPSKTLIFQQSRVPQHTELAWIMNCNAKMGELGRMTQFKEKSLKFFQEAQKKKFELDKMAFEFGDLDPKKIKKELEIDELEHFPSVSVGLFDYPVLMAADILLYDTQQVPVGADQKQHVELARDLAIRFNKTYGETFIVPEPVIRKEGARVMGLDDPMKKMSKSASSAKNYISLMDDAATVEKKIKSAVTDSGSDVKAGPDRPALTNLLTIFSLVTGKSVKEIEKTYEGKGYGDFKKDLAAAVNAWLAPLQEKIKGHLSDEAFLIATLETGALKARELAEAKMKLVRQKIGVAL